MTAAAPQRTSMHIASNGKKYTFFLSTDFPIFLLGEQLDVVYIAYHPK